MAQCMCKLVLDVADRDGAQTVVARQGDNATRFLSVRLMSCGEPLCVEESATVIINVKNASGEVRAFEGAVNADGALILPINAWALRSVGTVQCDVSIFDAAGGRLTTPPFEIEVVSSLSAGDSLPGDTDGTDSITAKLIAQERMYVLTPTATAQGYLVEPLCNRKYALDLSGEDYAEAGNWKTISLVLPEPEDADSDNWILIYCHAPLRQKTAVSIDWGVADALLFADGEIPEITKGDFDIVCTHSRVAGKWQIGVLQYGSVVSA